MTSLCPKGTQFYKACCQAFQEYCGQDTLVGCLDEFETYLATLEAWLKHAKKCTLCQRLSTTAALQGKEKEECDGCDKCEGCGH